MLPRSRVLFLPAGKAPRSGADAVKASYAPVIRASWYYQGT
jgi:hypothetical protein